MKLVGGDSGRYERETFVEDVLLAPSERAVVDVLFDAPGEVRLEHRTPDRVYDLGAFTVAPATDGGGAAAGSFATLRTDPELTAERRLIDARPRPGAGQGAGVRLEDAAAVRRGRRAGVVLRLPDAPRGHRDASRRPARSAACDWSPRRCSYVCPMHPDVTAPSRRPARSAG